MHIFPVITFIEMTKLPKCLIIIFSTHSVLPANGHPTITSVWCFLPQTGSYWTCVKTSLTRELQRITEVVLELVPRLAASSQFSLQGETLQISKTHQEAYHGERGKEKDEIAHGLNYGLELKHRVR